MRGKAGCNRDFPLACTCTLCSGVHKVGGGWCTGPPLLLIIQGKLEGKILENFGERSCNECALRIFEMGFCL